MSIHAVDQNFSPMISSNDSVRFRTRSTSTNAKPQKSYSFASSGDILRKSDYELSISESVVKKAIQKANKALSGEAHQFQYSVHGENRVIVVKVINADTKEVIREIPPEKIIDLIDKLQELVAGAIIDEKR